MSQRGSIRDPPRFVVLQSHGFGVCRRMSGLKLQVVVDVRHNRQLEAEFAGTRAPLKPDSSNPTHAHSYPLFLSQPWRRRERAARSLALCTSTAPRCSLSYESRPRDPQLHRAPIDPHPGLRPSPVQPLLLGFRPCSRMVRTISTQGPCLTEGPVPMLVAFCSLLASLWPANFPKPRTLHPFFSLADSVGLWVWLQRGGFVHGNC